MKRIFVQFILVTLLFVLAACSSQQPEPIANKPDDLTITLLTPQEDVRTKGVLEIEVSITGKTPDSVLLLANDKPLSLLESTLHFKWDTTTVEARACAP